MGATIPQAVGQIKCSRWRSQGHSMASGTRVETSAPVLKATLTHTPWVAEIPVSTMNQSRVWARGRSCYVAVDGRADMG